MVLNLQRAGARPVIHNRSQAVVKALARVGMTVATTPRDLAAQMGAGVIVLMLTNAAAVEEVVSGPTGIFAGLKRGALVIDMGSSGVRGTLKWAQRARALGAGWMDAPVSGGQVGAIKGALTIMAGGSKSAFRRASPIFSVLGSTVVHVGESGAGQITKLSNQIVVALTIAAVAEAFTLAQAVGVKPALVRTALLGGFASSRILDVHGRRMIEENFVPGGRATGQLKDVVEAVRLMREQGLDLPMLRANLKRWQKMIGQGWGDLDHSGLIKIYSRKQWRRAKRKSL